MSQMSPLSAAETVGGALTRGLHDALRQQIRSGQLAPGAQLPTERELGGHFGVIRVTVRRALSALSQEGLVVAVRGRGTFVASGLLAEPANALMSFHELAARDGFTATSSVLSATVRPCTLDEAEQLRVVPGAELFDLVRRRSIGGLPVALDATLVPLEYAPHLPRVDWEVASLYREMAEAGQVPVAADVAVEARAATPEEADELGTSVGAPVLVAESDAYASDGRVVVIGRIVYRGDRYRLRTRVDTSTPFGAPTG